MTQAGLKTRLYQLQTQAGLKTRIYQPESLYQPESRGVSLDPP